MAKEPMQLNVIARAPFQVYYEGPAEIVSAINRIGPFDVLPGHADFFSILQPCEVTIDKGDEYLTFVVSNGIITVRNDTVMLFCNI